MLVKVKRHLVLLLERHSAQVGDVLSICTVTSMRPICCQTVWDPSRNKKWRRLIPRENDLVICINVWGIFICSSSEGYLSIYACAELPSAAIIVLPKWPITGAEMSFPYHFDKAKHKKRHGTTLPLLKPPV